MMHEETSLNNTRETGKKQIIKRTHGTKSVGNKNGRYSDKITVATETTTIPVTYYRK